MASRIPDRSFCSLGFKAVGVGTNIAAWCSGWFRRGWSLDRGCSLFFALTLPISIVNVKSLTFQFVEGCRMFNGEHMVFDSLGKAVIESLVKCGIIPFNVRGQLSKCGHMAIDMVAVEHLELANGSFRHLDDIGLTE